MAKAKQTVDYKADVHNTDKDEYKFSVEIRGRRLMSFNAYTTASAAKRAATMYLKKLEA